MKQKAILLSFIAIHTFLLSPLTPLFAQGREDSSPPDLIAPHIQHEPSVKAAVAGEPLAIEAIITDDVRVEEVLLHYRLEGSEEYAPIRMESAGETLYSAILPREEVTPPRIEYYIQATDPAGNIALRGLSFTPLSVSVVSVPVEPETAPAAVAEGAALERITLRTEDPPPPRWYKKWWVWTIVGAAVIAGGMAAAGGREDGGGEKGGPSSAGGPTGGSVAITGPTP
jgi:hypothetical protein